MFIAIPLIVLAVGLVLHVLALKSTTPPSANRTTLLELSKAMIWVGLFFSVAQLAAENSRLFNK